MSPVSVSSAGKKPVRKSPAGVRKKSKVSTPFPGERERRRKLFVERMILGATFAFCALLVFAVWFSEGRVLDGPTRFLERFAGKDAQAPRDFAQNCRHPKNKNTPYCLDKIAETEAEWQSMSRTQGGRTNQFTLHNN